MSTRSQKAVEIGLILDASETPLTVAEIVERGKTLPLRRGSVERLLGEGEESGVFTRAGYTRPQKWELTEEGRDQLEETA